MKRRFFLAMIVLSLIICAVPALALDTELKVYDYADLFDDEEEELLMERAQELAEERRMDVVILTIDDAMGQRPRDIADDFFDYNGFGYGRGRDGILLLIDMDNRRPWISTSGKAIDIFTDNRLDSILDKMDRHLQKERFFDATNRFLTEVDYYTSGGFAKSARHIPGYLIVSVAAAGIIVALMAAYNKGVKTVTSETYLDRDSVNIRVSRDNYIRTTTTKVDISSSSSGSGGGRSSTHRSSSGRTHGGRGGRRF